MDRKLGVACPELFEGGEGCRAYLEGRARARQTERRCACRRGKTYGGRARQRIESGRWSADPILPFPTLESIDRTHQDVAGHEECEANIVRGIGFLPEWSLALCAQLSRLSHIRDLPNHREGLGVVLTTQNLETDATNPPGLPLPCLALLVLGGAMADSLRKGFNPECVARHRQNVKGSRSSVPGA